MHKTAGKLRAVSAFNALPHGRPQPCLFQDPRRDPVSTFPGWPTAQHSHEIPDGCLLCSLHLLPWECWFSARSKLSGSGGWILTFMSLPEVRSESLSCWAVQKSVSSESMEGRRWRALPSAVCCCNLLLNTPHKYGLPNTLDYPNIPLIIPQCHRNQLCLGHGASQLSHSIN